MTNLGFNNGKGGKRTTPVSIRHFSGSLQETGVEVEHITGVSFTTRRSTEQQGHLSVGYSLFGQIVVDDQSVLAWTVGVYNSVITQL